MDLEKDRKYLGPPDALLTTVRADLAGERRRRWIRWIIYGLLVITSFSAYGFVGTDRFKMLSTPDRVGALAFLGMGLGFIGLAMGVILPRARALWRCIGLLFTLTIAALFYSGISAQVSPLSFWTGYSCLLEAVLLGVVGLLVALKLGYGSCRRHAPTGMLLGMGAALVALAPLHVGCSNKSLTHLMSWHATAIAVICLVTLAFWHFIESD